MDLDILYKQYIGINHEAALQAVFDAGAASVQVTAPAPAPEVVELAPEVVEPAPEVVEPTPAPEAV